MTGAANGQFVRSLLEQHPTWNIRDLERSVARILQDFQRVEHLRAKREGDEARDYSQLASRTFLEFVELDYLWLQNNVYDPEQFRLILEYPILEQYAGLVLERLDHPFIGLAFIRPYFYLIVPEGESYAALPARS